MASKYKVGNIVRLKSGGPDMTVQSEGSEYPSVKPNGVYHCQWFAGKKLESGNFPEASLEPGDAKPPVLAPGAAAAKP